MQMQAGASDRRTTDGRPYGLRNVSLNRAAMKDLADIRRFFVGVASLE